MLTDNKTKVIEHYNELSSYYKNLWGIHIHHGFWQTGKESKETAQQQLIEKLTGDMELGPNLSLLDVGCGIGGSSVYLAKKFGVDVTGITISETQVSMAQAYAKEQGIKAKFLVMDADNITLGNKFDVVWSIEAISHFMNRGSFFKKSADILKPGGSLALTDWFVVENLDEKNKKIIESIKSGMLVPNMDTMNNYVQSIESTGLKIVNRENISQQVAKTWDISLDIIKNKSFWKLALTKGKDFVKFLEAFKAMKDGYTSGALAYGIIVAQK